jgi:uncharacterized protein (TIGR02001 family)
MRALLRNSTIGGALLVALTASGQAQETVAVTPMFDVAFGAELTSDYMSRGTTQTDGGPAIQGYIEADVSSFYAGVWASNVDYGFDDTEIDFSIGWRPELGKFSFDLGYVYYYYIIDDGSSYGDIFAKVNYAVNDWLTIGGQVFYGPDYVQSSTDVLYTEANTEIALPWDFSLSGALGYQDFEEEFGTDYWTWNAGVSWTWRDALTFDVRYWDTDLTQKECAGISTRRNSCDARVVASVAFDTSWSALKELTGMGR